MAEDIIAINSGVYTSLGTAIIFTVGNNFIEVSGKGLGIPITQINQKFDARFDDPTYYTE